MYGDWRKPRNKIIVTADTVIPDMPKPLLEDPDEAEYHRL